MGEYFSRSIVGRFIKFLYSIVVGLLEIAIKIVGIILVMITAFLLGLVIFILFNIATITALAGSISLVGIGPVGYLFIMGAAILLTIILTCVVIIRIVSSRKIALHSVIILFILWLALASIALRSTIRNSAQIEIITTQITSDNMI